MYFKRQMLFKQKDLQRDKSIFKIFRTTEVIHRKYIIRTRNKTKGKPFNTSRGGVWSNKARYGVSKVFNARQEKDGDAVLPNSLSVQYIKKVQ